MHRKTLCIMKFAEPMQILVQHHHKSAPLQGLLSSARCARTQIGCSWPILAVLKSLGTRMLLKGCLSLPDRAALRVTSACELSLSCAFQVGLQKSLQHTGSKCSGHRHWEQEWHSQQHTEQGPEDISAQAQVLSHGHHGAPPQRLDRSTVAGTI